MRKILALSLVIVGCSTCPTSEKSSPETPKSEVVVPQVPVSPTITGITDMAASSKCANYFWADRGKAPKAYIKGMAVSYAKAVCTISSPEVAIVAKARTYNDEKDALSWYNSNFSGLNMNNSKDGQDTLRHAYTLLIGLGMRESSGKHCEGRDMSADFSTADSAEAGLFQGSWGARRSNPILPGIIESYMNGSKKCYLATFAENVKCSESDAKTWGTGAGAVYQKMAKECPAFSVEYTAILLRTTGGTKGEFGPLRKKAAEIRTECNDMLKQVDAVIKANPDLCQEL